MANLVELISPPSHPGTFLKEVVLPNMGLTQAQFAAALKVSRVTLSKLLSGRQPVTVEMARRLGRALGTGPRFWLEMQARHDGFQAEKEEPVDIRPLGIVSPVARYAT